MPTLAPNGSRTASSGGSRVSKAEILRALHSGPKILVLPNAWDVASARIFETAGFAAIGTTSAGIAMSLGYPDGQHVSREEMLDVIDRIVRAVSIPVTADVESGYGDPEGTSKALAEIGAAGMNLEDSATADATQLVDIPAQVKIIHSVRAATDLVINARTDVFLMSIGDPATRLDRTIERLRAFSAAGADCVFVPGVRDAETIRSLAALGRVNILAVAGTPPIAELERLGVARVSIGSGAMRASMGLTQRIATELRDRGTFSSLTDGATPFADANALFR
jgi:2-methylisocitrate lyase-like PEP mutase family enzyme